MSTTSLQRRKRKLWLRRDAAFEPCCTLDASKKSGLSNSVVNYKTRNRNQAQKQQAQIAKPTFPPLRSNPADSLVVRVSAASETLLVPSCYRGTWQAEKVQSAPILGLHYFSSYQRHHFSTRYFSPYFKTIR
jgi:hypothetical protein